MGFVAGSYPQGNAVHWEHCDRVIGVAHVMNCHFVAYELLMHARAIIVYDSLSETYPFKRYQNMFNRLGVLLPSILSQAGIEPKKKMKRKKIYVNSSQWLNLGSGGS